MGVRIGVVAIQGDVSEHVAAFRKALDHGHHRGSAIPVRAVADIAGCDALALPGGESTTIMRIMERTGLRERLMDFEGAVFATCAGMVLVARSIEDDTRIKPLGKMDYAVRRNAFGRQRESFEADIDIAGLDSPYHAVFIRAPLVTAVGTGVETLARLEQGIVAVREGLHMAFAFHPELTPDLRLHRLFLDGLE